MILVTGGTGLVGSHLLYKLTRNYNEPIRAIYRSAQKLEAVKHVFGYYTDDVEILFDKIEWIVADINDVPALAVAFVDITHVYHCAAFVSFEPDKYKKLRKINIEGTANIVNFCISENITKLCYVSSIAAIGNELEDSKLITEKTPWTPDEDHSAYAITKYGGEIEVWRSTQEGVNAVIINPGVILGPGFWHGGGSGSLITKIYNGFPYYSTGITGYVDVDDVTDIMLQLMHGEIKNQSFIVVAENLSFKDFQEKVAMTLGTKVAQKQAGHFILGVGWRLDWMAHHILGRPRKLSKQMAKTALTKTSYDASKLKKTLGYKFKSIDTTINCLADFYKDDLNK